MTLIFIQIHQIFSAALWLWLSDLINSLWSGYWSWDDDGADAAS